METLPGRSQTMRTTETTLIAWIELSSIRTIGTIGPILKRSYGEGLRRLGRSGRSKAIPEIITFVPVIENILAYIRPGWRCSQQSTTKCSHRVWALLIFEIRESPWHQVLDVIVCFRRTLLASRLRIIKRKSRLKGTRLVLRIKIMII